MIFWAAIVFLAIIGLLFFKFEHYIRIARAILIILFIVLIYLSMNSVLKSNEVDISSPKGIINAIYVYIGWMGETTMELLEVGKQTASMTGNAIKVDSSDKVELPGEEKDFSPIDWITDKIRKD